MGEGERVKKRNINCNAMGCILLCVLKLHLKKHFFISKNEHIKTKQTSQELFLLTL